MVIRSNPPGIGAAVEVPTACGPVYAREVQAGFSPWLSRRRRNVLRCLSSHRNPSFKRNVTAVLFQVSRSCRHETTRREARRTEFLFPVFP